MAILTDDADYDAGETSWNVPRPRSDFGNDHAGNGLRTRLINRVNDSFRIRSVSRISSSGYKTSSKALIAFSPKMFCSWIVHRNSPKVPTPPTQCSGSFEKIHVNS
ncbi:unnamed protein product [Protopolystoma xenopodis]|uniref:Uncharacterized protein n=1 Tax=Protopolystoma xenopodis TaxID=117903 RepID=A0A448XM20_9PLAT|nr:unnamed protein product [Protopolystoma xenopodis]